MNIIEAVAALQAGHHIAHDKMIMKNASFYLETHESKDFLFVRSVKTSTGEVIESPAVFDWDDVEAKDWHIVN